MYLAPTSKFVNLFVQVQKYLVTNVEPWRNTLPPSQNHTKTSVGIPTSKREANSVTRRLNKYLKSINKKHKGYVYQDLRQF